ncbi:hypothetical protein AB0H71_10140 [Nocardia sp. NPDC050697]|uniref:hypothetical protein n=1 Tax=Nocardia sp. NPDC050697 TaxID=3155158 RepID=UPI0033F52B33
MRKIAMLVGTAAAAALTVAGAGNAAADPVIDAYVQAATAACEEQGYTYDAQQAAAGYRPATVQCVNRKALALVFVPIADGTPCTVLDGINPREGLATGGVCR